MIGFIAVLSKGTNLPRSAACSAGGRRAPREGGVLEAAQHIPTAKIADLDDIGGHRGSSSPRSLALFATEVQDLLKRIADGRPGISGPRIPKNWSRADYCPR